MANQLDLEEQEQLDQIKHYWKQYGNLITWILVAVLAAFAGWNGYQLWQRNQAEQASAMYDELDRQSRQADLALVERAFSDMKDRYPRTTYAWQGALLAAKVLSEGGKTDAANAALTWVVGSSADDGYKAIARLRLAGLLADGKSFDQALAQAPSNNAAISDQPARRRLACFRLAIIISWLHWLRRRQQRPLSPRHRQRRRAGRPRGR